MRSARELPHLLRRFVDSFATRPPSPTDATWATGLTDAAAGLWLAQSAQDQRHTIAVARALEPDDPPRWVLQAALLHDVGKTEAGLGTIGRTVATLLEVAGIRSVPGRLGRYLDYPRRGAVLLSAAGCDPLVARWAAEHHEEPERWTVPRAWAERLAEADRSAR